MQHHYRLHSLDGLRGIAAIAVMIGHVVPAWVPGGYLAVDFFFALSGFVIALSYTERLRGGMGLGAFVQLRLARLYPMILIGGALGVALHGGNPNMLLLVPDFHGSALYPTNPPFWSLLTEMLVNIAFALGLYRLGLRGTGWLLAALAPVYIALILSGPWPRGFGMYWDVLPEGILRTLCSFLAGAVLAQLWQRRGETVRIRRGPATLLVPAALAAAMLFGPGAAHWWAIAATFAVLPALVWAGAHVELPGQWLWKALGDLSYPLYCIHMPILYFCAEDTATRLLVAAALVPGALLVERLLERPARGWLRAWVRQRQAREAARAEPA